MSKVMLVEDDNNLREIYGARLVAEGYDIISAHDGEEALAMAIKERPSLILTDIMMPKISGFDMVDILRSTTETKDIKVIIMTALSRPEDQKRGEMLGADKYLIKSQITLEDVVKAIHETLNDAAPAEPTAPSPAPATPAPTPTAATPSSATAPAPPTAPAPVATPPAPTPSSPQPNPVPPVQNNSPVTPVPSQFIDAQVSPPTAAEPRHTEKVIQPPSGSDQQPTFQELVEKELAKESPEPTAPAPSAPTPPLAEPPQTPTTASPDPAQSISPAVDPATQDDQEPPSDPQPTIPTPPAEG